MYGFVSHTTLTGDKTSHIDVIKMYGFDTKPFITKN
jgi:hypothetical protein